MIRRILVLAMTMAIAISMTAGPVFADNNHGGGHDKGKDKDKVVCLVKHKAGKSGKYEVIKVPKHAAKKHVEKHGDKIIKCFKDKDKKDKDKKDKDKKDKDKKDKDKKKGKDKKKDKKKGKGKKHYKK